jgi:hypothetical protein
MGEKASPRRAVQDLDAGSILGGGFDAGEHCTMTMRIAGFGRRLAWAVALLGLIVAGPARGQELAKEPPRDSLARYFPSRGLVAYIEFDGVEAHRSDWEKTAAYRVLSETTTGAMLEQSAARLLDLALSGQRGAIVGGRDLVALGKHLLSRGFALGINRVEGAAPARCAAVVIRGAASGKARAVVDRLLRVGAHPRAQVKAMEKPGGRKVQFLGDPRRGSPVWWVEGEDLVVSLVAPTGVDAIIAALDGREPGALDHPVRAALARGADAPGFVPVGLAFFDRSVLELPRSTVMALGLDRVERYDYRWGFHGRAIEAIVGVEAPAPRTGILGFFDQPGFDAKHLPPLPPGLARFTVLSLDLVRVYDQFFALLKRIIPPNAAGADEEIRRAVDQTLGLKLRDEFLAHLGSRIVGYTVPTRVNAATNPLTGFAQGMVFVPKMSITVEVKDHDAITRALDTLAPRVNRAMRALADVSGGGEVGEFKRLKGEENGRVLSLPASILPMAGGLRPTLLVGPREVVIATSPATARRALDVQHRSKAEGLPVDDPLAEVLRDLPDRPVLLGVGDPRQSMMPELLVSLPNLLEYAIPRWVQGLPILAPLPTRGNNGLDSESQRPGRKLAMDPELIPEPDAFRPFLFPSVHALAVDDRGIRLMSREAFPSINPVTLAPAVLAMVVPAMGLAAQRGRSVDNFRQIGLALHNYHSAKDRFPADVLSKEGKPLLSWRVAILPQLGHQALYDEFLLDEPWDSLHNKALIERMPEVFGIPGSPDEPGMTYYRGFSGEHTFLDPKVPEGVGIASITDGTSNTIAVVEARVPVPWTRPDSDIPFGGDPTKIDAIQALRGELGGHFPGGFQALFFDGSVRFIKDSVNLITLRSLITRDGGEVISSDSY